MAASLTSFVHLSAVLTGDKNLPDDLAQDYFELAKSQLKEQLGALLDRFDGLVQGGTDPVAAVREDIFPNAALGAAAKIVLLLWYSGGVQNAAGDLEVGSADHYYRALVWKAIGAHPPTLSNGYFGHWKYPPVL